jgi:hypothetical protein
MLHFLIATVKQINAKEAEKEAAKPKENLFFIKVKEKGQFKHLVTVTNERDRDETVDKLEEDGRLVKTEVHPY